MRWQPSSSAPIKSLPLFITRDCLYYRNRWELFDHQKRHLSCWLRRRIWALPTSQRSNAKTTPWKIWIMNIYEGRVFMKTMQKAPATEFYADKTCWRHLLHFEHQSSWKAKFSQTAVKNILIDIKKSFHITEGTAYASHFWPLWNCCRNIEFLTQKKSRALVGDVAAVKCAVEGLPGFLYVAGGVHFICKSLEPSTSRKLVAPEGDLFGFVKLSSLPPFVTSLGPLSSGVPSGNPGGGGGGGESSLGFPVNCPYTAIAWTIIQKRKAFGMFHYKTDTVWEIPCITPSGTKQNKI